ncbi:isochorismatase family protein [Spiroplasma endosymbiont of Crioceris asparagi]|uniref:isochorismatase family protein n=1 Tax=Spiroplasma endosymbiont of Crioceris asparagi TaxID=3066286 RepID=UPI0030CB99EE
MMKCLIVVDYQYDFANPKGALYVKGGEAIKDIIEDRITFFRKNNWLVAYSMDWHPQNHISFKKWGEHCVQDQKGAEILLNNQPDILIKKGIKQNEDSYSAFYIAENVESSLKNFLQNNNVDEVEICGLARNVCVQATFDDAIKLGFKVTINEEASKSL